MNLSTIRGETQRLIIRDWQVPEDREAAFAIYGDPEVMAFIRPALKTWAEAEAQLRERQQDYESRNNGTGCWAMVEKATNLPVGTILLSQLPDAQGNATEDYEIGWHLRRDRWGLGYATEAGHWALNYGFQNLHLTTLYAVVKPDNQASIRVTQQLGMQPLGLTDQYYGIELSLFACSPSK